MHLAARAANIVGLSEESIESTHGFAFEIRLIGSELVSSLTRYSKRGVKGTGGLQILAFRSDRSVPQ